MFNCIRSLEYAYYITPDQFVNLAWYARIYRRDFLLLKAFIIFRKLNISYLLYLTLERYNDNVKRTDNEDKKEGGYNHEKAQRQHQREQKAYEH